LKRILVFTMILMLACSILLVSDVWASENPVNPVTGSSDTNAKKIEPLTVVESGGSLVSFDDISLPPDTYQQILIYAGITWDYGLPDYWGEYNGSWWVYNDLSYATPVSPPNYACNGYGAINPGFNFTSQANFDGAYFMTADAVSNPSAVRFVGYVSGVPTYYSEWLFLSSTPTYLSANFLGVDRVVVEMQGSGWFAMDDLSYAHEGMPLPAITDINPETLNLRSRGNWITCRIKLPEGYDVSDIDRTTMLLNSSIPVDSFWVYKLLKSVIGDHDDGIPHLMVKFSRTAVSEFILSKGVMYGNVTLTITGELYDGTSFEGSDVIMVRMPGHTQV